MRIIFSLMISFSMLGTASADTLEALFQRSTQAAADGRYEDALNGYARLIQSGVDDVDVYVNIATVYAKRGDLPHAILYFEKALKVTPGDKAAAEDLQHVEEQIAGQRAGSEGQATLQRDLSIFSSLTRGFSQDTFARTLLVSNVLLFLLLTLWIVRRPKRSARSVAIAAIALSGVALVLSGTGFAIKGGAFSDGIPAVILSDRLQLREGPGPEAQLRSEGRGGERGEVLRKSEGYVLLRLYDGRQGWAETQNVGEI